jgi:hypothetical protein
MTTVMAPSETWDEVLAAVEADVARTEELLTQEPAAPVDPVLAPAQWRLPVTGPELPPLEQMPAVPEELRERIRELRVRIVALQVQLATELRAARAAGSAPFVAPAAVAPPARYFDSRV